MQPTEITSLDNPRVKAVVRLHAGRHRRRQGLFVAQSHREVARAAEAGLRINELFSCPSLPHGDDAWAHRLLAAHQSEGVAPAQWFRVSSRIMAKLSIRENPDGVLATFQAPRRALSDLSTDQNALWLVAVGIAKPGNLGALARSAAASGAAGMIVADAVVDVFHPSAIRTSTGAVFTLPVVTADQEQVLRFLQDQRVAMLAASPEGSVVYHQHAMTGSVAIIVGPEDTGLNQRWLTAAAQSPGGAVVSIPMRGHGVDSLNASVAAAVLLFEAARQRSIT